MLTVEEIKTAIDSFSEKEYVSLRSWFSEKDWGKMGQRDCQRFGSRETGLSYSGSSA